MPTPKKTSLSALSRGDLEALTERLLAENAALKQALAELRAEVATLKGLSGRPKLKPSGMDKATEPEPEGRAKDTAPRATRPSGSASIRNAVIKAAAPAGSRFKG